MTARAPRPLRILQVQTLAEAGGTQRIASLVAEGLRSRGCEVQTVFLYRKTGAYDDDPNVCFISSVEPGGLIDRLKLAFRLVRYVIAEKADAVLTYHHQGNAIGALAGRLSGAHVVIANQFGNPDERGLRRLLTWIDKLYAETGIYDHIVVNSGIAEARYRTRSKRYVRRLVRIEHGLQIAATPPGKQSARDRLHLPRTAHLLVTTGRLATGKNQDVLIKSLQHLPGVHLALAGAGPERAALESVAETLELEDRVHFVGELEAGDIPGFLAAGDLFLFASGDETFGMSVVEAALAGLPIIAGDIPVLREVLASDDGACPGLFFPLGDHRALARSVERVLASPQLAKELGEAGRSLAGRYSVDRMIDAYEDLIRNRVGR